MKRTALVLGLGALLVLTTLLGASRADSARVFGLYKGTVMPGADPLGKNRLRVKVAYGTTTTEEWAQPSLPYTDGTTAGIKLPPPGADVWVEFEAGDPRLPVWIGWKPR